MTTHSHFVGGYTTTIKVGNHKAYYLKPLQKTSAGALKIARQVVSTIRKYEKAVGERRSKIETKVWVLGEDNRLHRVWGARRTSKRRRTSRR